MIRVTQSYLINATIDFFIHAGWNLIYTDFPGGRRSGVGLIGNINKIWERLYNLSPDIVFEKDGTLLIIEVDSKLNENYISKFKKYKSKSKELRDLIGTLLKKEIGDIQYGFTSKTKVLINGENIDLQNFHYLHPSINGLGYRIINPS